MAPDALRAVRAHDRIVIPLSRAHNAEYIMCYKWQETGFK